MSRDISWIWAVGGIAVAQIGFTLYNKPEMDRQREIMKRQQAMVEEFARRAKAIDEKFVKR
jgi:hypothetical protein